MPNRSSRYAKKIEVVHWTYGSFVFAAQAAGTAAVSVLSAQHLPETLLRIRGEWALSMVGVQAPQRGLALSIGLILVPEGTGTTVLWSPITDGDAPWMWWDTMHLLYNETVVDVIGSQATLSGRRVIDSKAMRKDRNQELQCVIENASIIGGASVDVVGSVRVLAGS